MDQSPVPPGAQEPWDAGPGLLEAVWQYRWLVAAATVLAGLVAFAASFLQPTQYEGEAELLLADPRDVGVFREDTAPAQLDSERYVRNQAQFVQSTPVYARTAELLDGRLSVRDIEEQTSIQASVDVDVVTIRARDADAQGAAEFANAVGTAYQELRRDEVQAKADQAIGELDANVAELQDRIDRAEGSLDAAGDSAALQAERDGAVSQLIALEGRADQIAVDAALFGSGVELFEEAEPPESPAQPQPARNAAVAAVLGLLGASAFSWWRAEQTQSAEERGDVAGVINAPALGEVREFNTAELGGPVPTLTAPHSAVTESYQFVVSALEYALGDAGGKTVLVTSAVPGNGKTTTVANLGVAAVRDGRNVVLVDADERQRGLTTMLEVSPEPGLTDLVEPALPMEGCLAYVSAGDHASLPVLPAGSALSNPAAFFRTSGFRTAMSRVSQRGDLVLVDAPPMLTVSDASAIAGQVDAIIVVVARGTRLSVLRDLRERLDFIGTPLLGYVFNRASGRGSGGDKGYGGYGYGYGYSGSGNGNGAGNGKPSKAAKRKAGKVEHEHGVAADRR